ncbi:MAG: pyrroloquinoline quinone precursor peptide PqqA [Candidatus Acidiferrum sp.]
MSIFQTRQHLAFGVCSIWRMWRMYGACMAHIGVLILVLRWVKLEKRFEAATLETKWEKRNGRNIMQWTAPAFEEVCLNCEINSYASAKL